MVNFKSMKKTITSIIYVSTILFSVEAIAGSKSESVVVKKNSSTSNLPAWIIDPYDITENPEVTSFKYCAVGSAPDSGNPSNQRRIARINAQTEISKNMELEIEDKLKVQRNVNEKNKEVKENESSLSTETRQRSNAIITNYKEINSYMDEANKIYYIRLCI